MEWSESIEGGGEEDGDGGGDGKSIVVGACSAAKSIVSTNPSDLESQELKGRRVKWIDPSAKMVGLGRLVSSVAAEEASDLGSLSSLFVDNIPPCTTRRCLWEAFGKIGRVCWVFISRKRRRGISRNFVFIRFGSRREDEAVLQKAEWLCIDNQVLTTKFPLYAQKLRRPNGSGREGFGGKGLDGSKGNLVRSGLFKPGTAGIPKTYAQMISGSGCSSSPINKDSGRNSHVISGSGCLSSPINKDSRRKSLFGKATNLDWLNRCAVAYVKTENTDQRIVDVLMREFKELKNVSIMGNQKLLIEFDSSGIRDEFISMGIWSDLFSHIKSWGEDLFVSDRSVWLECSGIPIQSRSFSTFVEIANIWGSLLCVYEETIKRKNCNKAFIFISNKCEVIDEVVDFWVDNKSFAINIKEISPPVPLEFSALVGIKDVGCLSAGTSAMPKNSVVTDNNTVKMQFEAEVYVGTSAMCLEWDAQAEAIASKNANLRSIHPAHFCAEDERTMVDGADLLLSLGQAVEEKKRPANLEVLGLSHFEAVSFKVAEGNSDKDQEDEGLRNKGNVSTLYAESISKRNIHLGNVCCDEPMEVDVEVPVSGVMAQDGQVGDEEDGVRLVEFDKEILLSDHIEALTGTSNSLRAKFEAIRYRLVEGVSDTIEMGLAMGLNIPLDGQTYIKEVIIQRQMQAMKLIFANG